MEKKHKTNHILKTDLRMSKMQSKAETSLSRPPILSGYNISPERAREAREHGRLLSMRTETSLVCNLKCRYCNGASGTPPPGEISFDVIMHGAHCAHRYLFAEFNRIGLIRLILILKIQALAKLLKTS